MTAVPASQTGNVSVTVRTPTDTVRRHGGRLRPPKAAQGSTLPRVKIRQSPEERP
jgi:hypothetical protein